MGLLITSINTPLAVSIGTSIVATGITGWVIFIYVFLAQDTIRKLDLLSDFGFVNAFEARSISIKGEYDSRVNDAREYIDILGFGLKALREDYIDKFPDWQRRANIRILLIDPEYPNEQFSFALQRDREERENEGSIRAQVLKFVNDTKHLIGTNNPHKFEIRLYKCLPSVNIFRVDDEMFWGPYLVREQSRNAPTFLIRKRGILFHRLADHFERIWSDDNLSRPVPSNWIGEK
ncbi:hypothetical protein [Candidatus Chloroploca asiatica]|uniref:hypothetical protein n=1 Tax=Candidatus Chloroploca asiatica TaxID=1506545 RepID=UPI001143651F|nr:hypothetical protein [Candidatus Chloroploca asiatica]